MALTAQQRKERRLGIGGSDIAAIFGISQYNTALDIFLEKISTEEPEEEEQQNQFTEWGNRHEPSIITKFEEVMLVKCETGMDTYVHPEYPYMRANIDARIDANTILECKTASYFSGKDWSPLGGDNIPEPYLLQCAYYAEVVNVSKVYIAVLIGGNDFRIYYYDRNPALGQIILNKVQHFWENHVLQQIPPEPVNLEDAVKIWRVTETDDIKVADDTTMELMRELASIKQQRAELDKLYDTKKLELCGVLQTSTQLNDDDGNALATWKNQSTNRFDSSRFKADQPELYQQYIKSTQSRVLRIKEL